MVTNFYLASVQFVSCVCYKYCAVRMHYYYLRHYYVKHRFENRNSFHFNTADLFGDIFTRQHKDTNVAEREMEEQFLQYFFLVPSFLKLFFHLGSHINQGIATSYYSNIQILLWNILFVRYEIQIRYKKA